MKKYIRPDDLPKNLDQKTIEILVEMCEEFPKTDFSWAKISELLLQRGQLNIILDIVQENEQKKEELRKSQMTESEKLEEYQKMEALKKEIEQNPHYFIGNMGQPETPQEFKNRYGVWPLGYDEKGNKFTGESTDRSDMP
jgi:hypothetical protein